MNTYCYMLKYNISNKNKLNIEDWYSNSKITTLIVCYINVQKYMVYKLFCIKDDSCKDYKNKIYDKIMILFTIFYRS